MLVGTLQALPVTTGTADLVVTALALTHVPDLGPVFAEFARVLRPGGHLVVSDVHPGLVLLGSVVKGVSPTGQAQLASTHRHSTADFLRAALGSGFEVRCYEEEPRLDTAAEAALPEVLGDRRLAPVAVDADGTDAGGHPGGLAHPGRPGLALPARTLTAVHDSPPVDRAPTV